MAKEFDLQILPIFNLMSESPKLLNFMRQISVYLIENPKSEVNEMCIEYIYRHIRQLPLNQIFTTRDMLIYGSRSGVDSALHRMVRSGFIVRCARGVFIRKEARVPNIRNIVKAKTKAFGLQVFHEDEIHFDVRLKNSDRQTALFWKVGGSSSFDTVHGRAHLRRIAEKKAALRDTPVGRSIFWLWQLGQRCCKTDSVRLATKHFGRSERQSLWRMSTLMPAWLSEICSGLFPHPVLLKTVRN
jgi:hypothetical protein